MTEKSHVSTEQHVCLVCGKQFDSGAILIDRRLRASLDRHTVTGWGLCPTHQALFDDGFVALVECDPEKSGRLEAGGLAPEKAYRTGRVMHMKREDFADLCTMALESQLPCVFVSPDVIEELLSFVATSSSSNPRLS